RHAAALERHPGTPGVLHPAVHHAAPGRFLAPERPAERDRLAGHGGRRVAVTTRVLVQDPGHHLRVGVHVRRGDVAVGPQHDGDALGEAPGEALELELGELLRVDGDAALGTAERNVHALGLPPHYRGERVLLVVFALGTLT